MWIFALKFTFSGYRCLISNHSESASADRGARQMRERLAPRRPNHFQASLRRKERIRLVSGRFGRTPPSKIRRWNLLDSGPCYRNMLFPLIFLCPPIFLFSLVIATFTYLNSMGRDLYTHKLSVVRPNLEICSFRMKYFLGAIFLVRNFLSVLFIYFYCLSWQINCSDQLLDDENLLNNNLEKVLLKNTIISSGSNILKHFQTI